MVSPGSSPGPAAVPSHCLGPRPPPLLSTPASMNAFLSRRFSPLQIENAVHAQTFLFQRRFLNRVVQQLMYTALTMCRVSWVTRDPPAVWEGPQPQVRTVQAPQTRTLSPHLLSQPDSASSADACAGADSLPTLRGQKSVSRVGAPLWISHGHRPRGSCFTAMEEAPRLTAAACSSLHGSLSFPSVQNLLSVLSAVVTGAESRED